MPPYDPRYRYPAGYRYGGAALGLADILGQGFDRLHRQNQDAQGQQNRDQEYLMRLQQFMAQQEDRDLDRQVKQDTLGLNRETRAQAAVDRAASAATAASGRSGLAKLLKMPSRVETEMASPVDRLPQDASDLEAPPSLLKVLGRRPSTRDDAMEGLSEDKAGHKDVADLLLKLYPVPKADGDDLKAINPEHDLYRGKKLIRPGVPKPKPFFEGKTPTELDIIIADPATPPDQKAIAQAALKSIREAELQNRRETGAVASENAKSRALGPQPITAEERQRVSEGERSVQLAQRSLATLGKNPSWAGGPLGLRGRGREWQSSLGTAPEGFAQFESDIAEIYGTYARRIAGAALSPTEKTTYLKYLPNLTTDSGPQFEAKLKAFPERVRVIDAALDRARLGTAAPKSATPSVPQIDTNAIDAELKRRGVK